MNYKKDLQKEQMAHAETKALVKRLQAEIKSQKKAPKEVVRYVHTPDLSQVSREELQRALNDYKTI